MSQLQVRDTYLSLRAILHSVGKKECLSRDFGLGTQAIGIHAWTWLAYSKIAELSRRRLWEGKVPNEPTIRRRANYLASPLWLDYDIPRPLNEPPLWKHLSLQIKDTNGWKGREVVELQSAYRPVEMKA